MSQFTRPKSTLLSTFKEETNSQTKASCAVSPSDSNQAGTTASNNSTPKKCTPSFLRPNLHMSEITQQGGIKAQKLLNEIAHLKKIHNTNMQTESLPSILNNVNSFNGTVATPDRPPKIVNKKKPACRNSYGLTPDENIRLIRRMKCILQQEHTGNENNLFAVAFKEFKSTGKLPEYFNSIDDNTFSKTVITECLRFQARW